MTNVDALKAENERLRVALVEAREIILRGMRMSEQQSLSRKEGFRYAQEHDSKANSIRAQAEGFMIKAREHERLAQRWRDWAEDEYGDVPCPGRDVGEGRA